MQVSSEGKPVTMREIRRFGRLQIRVVGKEDSGRPLDTKTPVIRASPIVRQGLMLFEQLRDFSHQLQKEQLVLQRRAKTSQCPQPDPDLELLPLPVGAEGHLQVDVDAEAGVQLYHHWRKLQVVRMESPVPLQGHLNDNRLQPDKKFRRAIGNQALKTLQSNLQEISVFALEQLLETSELDQRLICTLFVRNFTSFQKVLSFVSRHKSSHNPVKKCFPVFVSLMGIKKRCLILSFERRLLLASIRYEEPFCFTCSRGGEVRCF